MSELTLDHVIIAAEDLDAASDALSLALGRRPSWRGRHPSYGTANILFRLETSYIELLAPDPQAESGSATRSGQAWSGSLGRFLNQRGPGLFSAAFRTPDVFATAAAARAQGLPVEEPLPGSGVDLDTGATREWVNARIPPEATRGTRCFFITHKSPPSALPPAPIEGDPAAAVRDTLAVVATSSQPEGARGMWRQTFGLTETASGSEWRYGLGNATLILRSGMPRGVTTDAWDSLEVSVTDLEAAASRLAAAGIAATPIAGGALKIEVCGARLTLTEAR